MPHYFFEEIIIPKGRYEYPGLSRERMQYNAGQRQLTPVCSSIVDDVGVKKTPLIKPVFRKKREELWVCRVIEREKRGL
jgi:hypothetical protein